MFLKVTLQGEARGKQSHRRPLQSLGMVGGGARGRGMNFRNIWKRESVLPGDGLTTDR